MKTNITQKFRPFVKKMKIYSPIAPPQELAAELGLNIDEIIKLDANENPFGFPHFARKSLEKAENFSIYPDPAQKKLRKEISNYANCEESQIVVGAGADELIDLIMRLFIEKGDKILNFTPTFSYYDHLTSLNQGELVSIQRNQNFEIDLKNIGNINFDTIKLVVLCSPNNPSGNLIPQSTLEYFLKKGCLVMLDEAYYEFAGKSFSYLIDQYPNLIILRTFSKCFGLAGLRAGYSICSKDIADALMRIKPPYSVNIAAEEALISCLRKKEYFENQINEIIENREWLNDKLSQLKGIQTFPSSSNFILCKVINKNAEEIFLTLKKQGILIRYFKTDLLNNFLRISIGTKPQLEKLFEKLSPLLLN